MAAEGSWAPPAGGNRQQWRLGALVRPLQVAAGAGGGGSAAMAAEGSWAPPAGGGRRCGFGQEGAGRGLQVRAAEEDLREAHRGGEPLTSSLISGC